MDSVLQDFLGPLAPEHYVALPPCSRPATRAVIAAALSSDGSRVREMESARLARGLSDAADPYFEDVVAHLKGDSPSWLSLLDNIDHIRPSRSFALAPPFVHLPFAVQPDRVHGDNLTASCDSVAIPPPAELPPVRRPASTLRRPAPPTEIVILDDVDPPMPVSAPVTKPAVVPPVAPTLTNDVTTTAASAASSGSPKAATAPVAITTAPGTTTTAPTTNKASATVPVTMTEPTPSSAITPSFNNPCPDSADKSTPPVVTTVQIAAASQQSAAASAGHGSPVSSPPAVVAVRPSNASEAVAEDPVLMETLSQPLESQAGPLSHPVGRKKSSEMGNQTPASAVEGILPDAPSAANGTKSVSGRVRLNVFLKFDDVAGKVSIDWTEASEEPTQCAGDKDTGLLSRSPARSSGWKGSANGFASGALVDGLFVQGPMLDAEDDLPSFDPTAREDALTIRKDAPESLLQSLESELFAEENDLVPPLRKSSRNPAVSSMHARQSKAAFAVKTTPAKGAPSRRIASGTNASTAHPKTAQCEPDIIDIDADDDGPSQSRQTKRKRDVGSSSAGNEKGGRPIRNLKSRTQANTVERTEERRARLAKAVAGMEEPAPATNDHAQPSPGVDEVNNSRAAAVRRTSRRLRRPSGRKLQESSDSDDAYRREPDEDFELEAGAGLMSISVQDHEHTDNGDSSQLRHGKATTPDPPGHRGHSKTAGNSSTKSIVPPRCTSSPPSLNGPETERPSRDRDRRLSGSREGRDVGALVRKTAPDHIAQSLSRGYRSHGSDDVRLDGAGDEDEATNETTYFDRCLAESPHVGMPMKSSELWRAELEAIEKEISRRDIGSPDISSSDGELERVPARSIAVLQRILRPVHEDGRFLMSVDRYDEHEELMRYYKETRGPEAPSLYSASVQGGDAPIDGTDFLRSTWEAYKETMKNTESESAVETGSGPQTRGGMGVTTTNAMTNSHAMTTTHAMTQHASMMHRGSLVPGQQATQSMIGGRPGGLSRMETATDMPYPEDAIASEMAPVPTPSTAGGMTLRPRGNRRATDRTVNVGGGTSDAVGRNPRDTVGGVSLGDEYGDNSHGGSSDGSSPRSSDEEFAALTGGSKRARTHAKSRATRAKELQNRVCGDMIHTMSNDSKRKVLKWAERDFSWFTGDVDVMEVVANRTSKSCPKCAKSSSGDGACEESILLKLWKDMSWRKVRRMRHRAQGL